MPPTIDPRSAEFVATAAPVLAALMLAVERRDDAEVVAQFAKLLNAITAYNRAAAERPSDAPLRAAVARLDAGWRQP